MINVNEILKKHTHHVELLKNVHTKDGKPGNGYDRLMMGIKEIVEEVLKEAAKEAKVQSYNNTYGTTVHEDGYYGGPETVSINTSSILDVAKQVKYD